MDEREARQQAAAVRNGVFGGIMMVLGLLLGAWFLLFALPEGCAENARMEVANATAARDAALQTRLSRSTALIALEQRKWVTGVAVQDGNVTVLGTEALWSHYDAVDGPFRRLRTSFDSLGVTSFHVFVGDRFFAGSTPDLGWFKD